MTYIKDKLVTPGDDVKLHMPHTQLSGKYLSTISLIVEASDSKIDGAKNRQINSMDA